YVDQHDILEIQRVRRVLDQIGDDDRDEQRAERVREREARDEQGDRERTRRLDAYLSARDRPVALLGMFAVLLDVADVVEDVGRAGDRTERRHGDRDPSPRHRVEQLFREDDGDEYHALFVPLPRTDLVGETGGRAHEPGLLCLRLTHWPSSTAARHKPDRSIRTVSDRFRRGNPTRALVSYR